MIKLLSIGRLIEKKGYFDLIEAVNIINKTTKFEFELDIIGWGFLKEELENKIKELNIENINIIGAVSPEEIPIHLSKADIFVLPSIVDSTGETETLGVVFIEAMASGLAVIGTTVGGIPDVIEDGKNGFMVEPNNPKQLAEKIIYLMEHPIYRWEMGCYGRELAKKKFDWKVLVKDYMNIIESLRKKKIMEMINK